MVEHPDPARLGRRLIVRPEEARSTPTGAARSAACADDAVTDDARGLLAAGRTRRCTTDPTASGAARGCGSSSTSYAPAPRMLVFGAIDFAAAVARVGSFLGYQVTVATRGRCSRRPRGSPTPTRWSSTGRTATSPPRSEAGRIDARTVVCVLTHDPKFDVPLLEVALRLPEVAYIGAMGSRRTHDDRLERLQEAGLTDAELARLSSPIGLDLGARTPEETAVSIAAEIIALRWGGRGSRLAGRRRARSTIRPGGTPARSTCPTRQVRLQKRRNPVQDATSSLARSEQTRPSAKESR